MRENRNKCVMTIFFVGFFLDAMHYKCDGHEHTTNRWNKIRHTYIHNHSHVHRNVRQMISATEHHFKLHSFLLNGISVAAAAAAVYSTILNEKKHGASNASKNKLQLTLLKSLGPWLF